jgi:hypothetical protein
VVVTATTVSFPNSFEEKTTDYETAQSAIKDLQIF